MAQAVKAKNWYGYERKGSVSDRRRTDQTPERHGRARKNTKRWCKGKVGREHVTEIRMENWYGRDYVCGPSRWLNRWLCWEIVTCTVCGKHLGSPKECASR